MCHRSSDGGEDWYLCDQFWTSIRYGHGKTFLFLRQMICVLYSESQIVSEIFYIFLLVFSLVSPFRFIPHYLSPSILVFHLLSIHSIWYLLLAKSFSQYSSFSPLHTACSQIFRIEKKIFHSFIHYVSSFTGQWCVFCPVLEKSLFVKTVLCQDDHHTGYFCHVFFLGVLLGNHDSWVCNVSSVLWGVTCQTPARDLHYFVNNIKHNTALLLKSVR